MKTPAAKCLSCHRALLSGLELSLGNAAVSPQCICIRPWRSCHLWTAWILSGRRPIPGPCFSAATMSRMWREGFGLKKPYAVLGSKYENESGGLCFTGFKTLAGNRDGKDGHLWVGV